jgi:hypothetical protein
MAYSKIWRSGIGVVGAGGDPVEAAAELAMGNVTVMLETPCSQMDRGRTRGRCVLAAPLTVDPSYQPAS